MIKINLLPPYVFERQVVRRLMLIFAAALVFIVIAGVGLRTQRSSALASLQQELLDTQRIETQVKANQAEATAQRAKIGPITAKVKFIDDVMAYNEKAPALYEQLTRFTYEKVRYRQITLTDTQMEIEAYAPSLSDAGRYLLNLYRATDLFSQVTMSSVPGYAPGEGGGAPADMAQVARGRAMGARAVVRGFDFKVTCVLAKPLSAPSYTGATSSATGGSSGAGGASPSAAPSGSPGPPPQGGPPGLPPGSPMRGS
jgi:Tfp pilus assembly protein PilN